MYQSSFNLTNNKSLNQNIVRGGRRDLLSSHFDENPSFDSEIPSIASEHNHNETVIKPLPLSINTDRIDLDPIHLTPNRRDRLELEEDLRQDQVAIRNVINEASIELHELRNLVNEFRDIEVRNLPRTSTIGRVGIRAQPIFPNDINRYATVKDFLFGRSGLESGYRASLRVVINFIFMGMFMVRIVSMKQDSKVTQSSTELKNMITREDDLGVPYGDTFKYFAAFKIVEHIFSLYDFIHFKKNKKKVYWINYTHVFHRLSFYILCIIFMKNHIKMLWILALIDCIFQIIEYIVFVGKMTEMGKSYVNINIGSTLFTYPTQLLICLKLDDIIQSWSVALIPIYISSTIVLIFGIILFALKKHSYSDCWGKNIS